MRECPFCKQAMIEVLNLDETSKHITYYSCFNCDNVEKEIKDVGDEESGEHEERG